MVDGLTTDGRQTSVARLPVPYVVQYALGALITKIMRHKEEEAHAGEESGGSDPLRPSSSWSRSAEKAARTPEDCKVEPMTMRRKSRLRESCLFFEALKLACLQMSK